jgi:hypothetical protein
LLDPPLTLEYNIANNAIANNIIIHIGIHPKDTNKNKVTNIDINKVILGTPIIPNVIPTKAIKKIEINNFPKVVSRGPKKDSIKTNISINSPLI